MPKRPDESQCQMSESRDCPQEVPVEKLKIRLDNLIQQVEKLEQDMEEVKKFVNKGTVLFDNIKDSITTLRIVSERSQEEIRKVAQETSESIKEQVKILGTNIDSRLASVEKNNKTSDIKSNVAAALSGALLSVVALWKFLFDK